MILIMCLFSVISWDLIRFFFYTFHLGRFKKRSELGLRHANAWSKHPLHLMPHLRTSGCGAIAFVPNIQDPLFKSLDYITCWKMILEWYRVHLHVRVMGTGAVCSVHLMWRSNSSLTTHGNLGYCQYILMPFVFGSYCYFRKLILLILVRNIL